MMHTTKPLTLVMYKPSGIQAVTIYVAFMSLYYTLYTGN